MCPTWVRGRGFLAATAAGLLPAGRPQGPVYAVPVPHHLRYLSLPLLLPAPPSARPDGSVLTAVEEKLQGPFPLSTVTRPLVMSRKCQACSGSYRQTKGEPPGGGAATSPISDEGLQTATALLFRETETTQSLRNPENTGRLPRRASRRFLASLREDAGRQRWHFPGSCSTPRVWLPGLPITRGGRGF